MERHRATLYMMGDNEWENE